MLQNIIQYIYLAIFSQVQEELEREKSKANDDTTVTWIKKYRNLEKELDWVKALADKLEQSNKSYRKENERLQLSFSSQQGDRAELIKQLVLVKKDNARLKEEIESLKNSLEPTAEEKVSKFSRTEKRQKSNGNENVSANCIDLCMFECKSSANDCHNRVYFM